MKNLRAIAALVARTPLHPQWLLGRRAIPSRLRHESGVVLDIGAADRWLARFLDPAASYVALDYPDTATQLYGTIPDVFGDACRLPFADNVFDAVACFEVLEHVQDPESALAEISRVLKPGGYAVLSMPFLYPMHDAPHDYQRWTEYGWRRSVSRHGLQLRRISPTTHQLHAAAALMGLAITGPLQTASPAALLLRLPVAVVGVVTCNLLCWALSHVWPRWEAMTAGHLVELAKR